MSLKTTHQRARQQRGASFIIWIIALLPLFGLAALAVDVNHLFVGKAELQNAADSAALHGAQYLFDDSGDSQAAIAINEAEASVAGMTAAGQEIEFLDADVISWFGDANSALQVEVGLQQNAVQAWFGRVLGLGPFPLRATATAYVGYAISGTVDKPLAICAEFLLNDEGDYDCSVGNFIGNSSTAAWTSLSDEEADAKLIKDLVTRGEDELEGVNFGEEIGTTNGTVDVAFARLDEWWQEELGIGEREDASEAIRLRLPVIECGGDPPGPSNKVVGIVAVDVLFMADKAPPPSSRMEEAPYSYSDAALPGGEWAAPSQLPGENPDAYGIRRWNSFVEAFNIRGLDDADDDGQADLATYENGGYSKNTIYFKPDCERLTPPQGQTGVVDYGIRAKIPVLVD